MIRTKITRTLTLARLTPAGKVSHSYRSIVPVLALCMVTAARSQTAPGFLRGHIPPNVFTGVQPATPAATTPANAQYRFVTIDVPGAGTNGAFGFGINNAGLVTGLYNNASNGSNGLVWRNGTFHSLGNPGSADTALISVSNRGVAIGYHGDLTTSHAAMYSFASGAWTTLPDISGMPNNNGYGINNFGVAVGVAGGGNFNNCPCGPSDVVSWIWDPSSQSYSFFAVPGAVQGGSYAEGINDRGQIAGTFYDASGAGHGFLKDAETYTTFDVPGATYMVAYGINNSGTIVGFWGNLSGWTEGFVRTIDGTVTVVDFPGALETGIRGINDRGDISGYWADPKTGVWTPFVGFKR